MHKEIPLGSNFIDRDIAYLMQNPLHAAKDVKEKYKLGDDEFLDEVINHRLTELFEQMQAALMENSLYFKMPPVYMVLCGGGSQLDGIVEKTKDFFKIKKVPILTRT
jgi:cell division ATPase FtsA